jgi:UDP-N-acetylglucosamine--N-acetylmuramyl-(pentapeptide) pyrophosphoryl-undecaprenol N-acetylglucosamine transferase
MKVCFAGGGTAGHVFPALQVDSELLKRSHSGLFPYDRFWIGSTNVREQAWVTASGMAFNPISCGKLRRYPSWKNVTDVFNILHGIVQSYAILRRERPDVLFSKGGFVSVPPIVAAALLHIPSITHESDATAGLATRLNARFVEHVCLAYESSGLSLERRYGHKLVVTGTPVRFDHHHVDAAAARDNLGLKESDLLVVVIGGSQGAQRLNELVWRTLDELTSTAFVFHQTGTGVAQAPTHERYQAQSFVEEGLDDLLAAATVVVSRAGATALGELTELAKPMVLIPLGSGASRGDQSANANRLAKEGAAVMLADTVDDRTFVDTLHDLVEDGERRAVMAQRCMTLRTQGAEHRLADMVANLANRRKGA